MALRGQIVYGCFLRKISRCQIFQYLIGSLIVVVLLACFQRFLGFNQRTEERFVEAFVAQLAVEAFGECVLGGRSPRDVVPVDPCVLNSSQNGHAGNSVPLSETIVCGLPWSPMILCSIFSASKFFSFVFSAFRARSRLASGGSMPRYSDLYL